MDCMPGRLDAHTQRGCFGSVGHATGLSLVAGQSLPHDQVSSLLSATYAVPWPPFYEAIMLPFGTVNIDIGWFRQPLNTVLRWIDDTAGDWSCNLGDMSAKVVELFLPQAHFSLKRTVHSLSLSLSLS